MFNFQFKHFLSFLITINETPISIKMTPNIILKVKFSWKTVTPINKAVKGSSEPRSAVFVDPTNLTDKVIVSSDIIVGIIASPQAYSHKDGLGNIWSSVQKLRL